MTAPARGSAPSGSDAPEGASEPPRLAAGVRLHAPAEEGAKWVVQRGNTYYRVGADAARLLSLLDGRRTAPELVQACGPGWTVEAVHTALDSFRERRLLHGHDTPPPRRTPWVKFVPPLTVQFTVLRPGSLLPPLRPFFAAMANPLSAAAALALGLGGIFALMVQSAQLQQAMGAPLPAEVYLWVLAGLLASTALHEMGHAAVLVRYGGVPTRIGVMLFYLMPAFFCDVSDAWRLGRQQRVRIALAGIATQCIVAGAVALASLGPVPDDVRSGMLVFGVTAYTASLFNLIPFVKLDGYIALMSGIDVPYLRDAAMTDARRYLARLLFGGTYAPKLDLPWAVPYGLACLGLPLYLLATAAALWLDLVKGTGAVGTSLVVLGLGYAVYYAGRGARRLVSEARAGGAPTVRIAAVSTAVAAGGVAAAFLPVPYTVPGGYVSDGERTVVVLAPGTDQDVIAPGQRVELLRSGMVAESRTGAARITGASGDATEVPLSTFLPVLLDPDPEVPATAYPVAADGPVEAASGSARVHAGEVPVWDYLYRDYVRPLSDW